MIKHLLFPTPIYVKDVLNEKNLNKDLEKNIINWSKKDKGVLKTNVKGWHSTSDMHLKKEYKLLIDELFSFQNIIFKDCGIIGDPFLGNMWANINYPQSYNKLHTHPNSLWSGVYYVKAEKNSGNLYVQDPRPGADVLLPQRLDNSKLPVQLHREVYFEAKPGRLIMFPGWLPHGVDINNSKDIRISISFNFIQKI